MIPYYIEQSFQLESIPCVYLQEILKRLLAKLRLDASFLCLHRFVAFHVTLTIYAVDRNLVAYCHGYIYG